MIRDSRTRWKRIAAPLAVVLFVTALPAGAEPEILDYENSEDLLLKRINEHFDTVADDRILGLFARLRVSRGETEFLSEFELDTLTGILFRSPEYRDDLRALFERLPDSEALKVRSAVKSAAFWSLLANSRQHEDVKAYVDGQISALKPSSAFLFRFFQRPQAPPPTEPPMTTP